MHAILDFWRRATALVLIITLAACGGGRSSGAGSVSAAGLSKGTVQDSSAKDGTAAATPGAADAATQSPEVRYAP